MLTIKQIETFYWTGKLGTVQRAATKLHVTQSAATKRLQELGSISATPLFELAGRKLELTPKGLELLDLCEGFLAATARLDAVRNSARHVARVLQVGITELVALTWFPDFVRRMKSVYPQVILQPDVDLSGSLRDKVLDGRLDFAIFPEGYVSPAMAAIKLQEVQFSWFCPPDAFPAGQTVTLDDLARLPVIEQGAGSGITALCESLCAQAGVQIERISGSTSIVALAGLIEAGVGVSCLPLSLFASEIKRNQLQAVRTDPPAPRIAYFATFLKQHQAALGYAVADIARQCCDFSAHKDVSKRKPHTRRRRVVTTQ